MKEIRPRSRIHATVMIPGSKSISHRALIAAALCEGESSLKKFLACEDTLYTVNALRELGAGIFIEGENAVVSGTGGEFHHTSGLKDIYLGNSGTSYRLLLSTIALASGDYILDGTSRMRERPVGELVRVLNKLGVEASFMGREDFPPVFIRAKGIRGGKVEIQGQESSQYVSSLLLAGPYAEKDVEIEITGRLVSRPYVDLTLDVMEHFGVAVVHEGYRYFRILSGQMYTPRQFRIEGDVSSASYFWAAAAVTGGTIVTENIHSRTTRQGDIGFLDILEDMGCRVERGIDRVTISGGTLSGIEVDMGTMPDMVPTLAAIALFNEGKTVIRNVAHLRHKESDRLRSIALEWHRLGGQVKELPDGLIVRGGIPLSGTAVNPHDDHRMAMGLAVVGLRVPGVKVVEEGCVNKSFPGFWALWDGL